MLDLFLLTGPTPEDVVRQYQSIVGKPAMPPAWALGFHQSRWGYQSVQDLVDVISGYKDAGIPLDTVWSDIDHMDGFRDFTLDQQQYAAPKMAAFLSDLHARGRRWVPIVDPGIKVDPGYPAYDSGVAQGVFVKDAEGGAYVGQVLHSSPSVLLAGTLLRQTPDRQCPSCCTADIINRASSTHDCRTTCVGAPLCSETCFTSSIAQVWPGAVHFPDFTSNVTKLWWQSQLSEFRQLAQWDGLWIDMNEVSNFCTGDVCSRVPASGSTDCRLTCHSVQCVLAARTLRMHVAR